MGLIRLDQSVQELLASGVAPSTLPSYSSGRKCYLTFCCTFGLCLLPLQESTLCRFAASLAGESLCHQTIVSYLSACHYFQILSGLPNLSLSPLPQLSYVLKGVRRMSLVPRLPVTPKLLRGVLLVWSRAPPTFDKVMLWAAFSMGFFAFLRVGEFTCQSLESFDQSSMLALGNVWVDSHSDPRCLTVKLKRSKGDPFGADSSRAHLSASVPSSHCTFLFGYPPFYTWTIFCILGWFSLVPREVNFCAVPGPQGLRRGSFEFQGP